MAASPSSSSDESGWRRLLFPLWLLPTSGLLARLRLRLVEFLGVAVSLELGLIKREKKKKWLPMEQCGGIAQPTDTWRRWDC